MTRYYGIVRNAVVAFVNDRTFSRAAALAYYTVFSMAPLLILSIAAIGLVYDAHAVRMQLATEFGGIIGAKSAVALEQILENGKTPTAGIAALFGGVSLLLGATSVFVELKDALDQIWEVPPKLTRGLWYVLRKRFLSFGLMLAVGFLLLVSLVFSAVIAALQQHWLLSGSSNVVLELLNALLSFVLVSAMFGTIYKLLPAVHVAWRDVLVGTLITAALFSVGKALIGIYLGRSGVESAYGAAGSIVLLLLWIYYSAIIFLLGAQITHSYALQRSKPQPRSARL